MNELSLKIQNPYQYDTKKYCFNLFETMHIQVIPWNNAKGYVFFSHPCFCYSTVCPQIHDQFSDFVEAPMDLLLSDKRMNFLNKIVAEQDFSLCHGCPKYQLRETTGFWDRDDFEYMFERKYGSKCYDGFKYRHLTTILPLTIMFNLDTSCNLKCKTCRSNFITKTHTLTDEDIAQLVYMAKKVECVSLGGDGEFFVSKNYRRILASDLSKDSNIRNIVLYTNGTMFDQKHWDMIHDSSKPLIKEVKISLDAATPETYAAVRGPIGWKMVMKNMPFIWQLKDQNGIKLSTTYTISKYNIQDVRKFYDFATDLGFDYIMFQFAREVFHPEAGEAENFIVPSNERQDIMNYLLSLQQEHGCQKVLIE